MRRVIGSGLMVVGSSVAYALIGVTFHNLSTTGTVLAWGAALVCAAVGFVVFFSSFRSEAMSEEDEGFRPSFVVTNVDTFFRVKGVANGTIFAGGKFDGVGTVMDVTETGKASGTVFVGNVTGKSDKPE